MLITQAIYTLQFKNLLTSSVVSSYQPTDKNSPPRDFAFPCDPIPVTRVMYYANDSCHLRHATAQKLQWQLIIIYQLLSGERKHKSTRKEESCVPDSFLCICSHRCLKGHIWSEWLLVGSYSSIFSVFIHITHYILPTFSMRCAMFK